MSEVPQPLTSKEINSIQKDSEDLNNFRGLLPGSRGEKIEDIEADMKKGITPKTGLARYNSVYLNIHMPGSIDIPHLKLQVIAGCTKEELLEVGHSELYLKQSDKQFFNQIDSIIEELDTMDDARIYNRLREIGYSHTDLAYE